MMEVSCHLDQITSPCLLTMRYRHAFMILISQIFWLLLLTLTYQIQPHSKTMPLPWTSKQVGLGLAGAERLGGPRTFCNDWTLMILDWQSYCGIHTLVYVLALVVCLCVPSPRQKLPPSAMNSGQFICAYCVSYSLLTMPTLLLWALYQPTKSNKSYSIDPVTLLSVRASFLRPYVESSTVERGARGGCQRSYLDAPNSPICRPMCFATFCNV